MPTISLRLTDEEHALLTAWAHDGKRSIQKEVIWRLFTSNGIAPVTATLEPRHAPVVKPAVTYQPPTAPAVDDPHFKPDFGKKISASAESRSRAPVTSPGPGVTPVPSPRDGALDHFKPDPK